MAWVSFIDPKGQMEVSCILLCILITARLEMLRNLYLSLAMQTQPNGKSSPCPHPRQPAQQ